MSRGDRIRVKGTVYFQPQNKKLMQVQVIVNGDVAHVTSQSDDTGIIHIDHALTFDDSSWVALRVNDETNLFPQSIPSQLAHSGAIYISVLGGRSLAEQPSAQRIARNWSAGLDDLAAQLSDIGRTAYLQSRDAEGDPLPTTAFASQQVELIKEAREASGRLRAISEGN